MDPPTTPPTTPPPVEPPAGTVIRLIHLNDLHAHLTPHVEQIRDAAGTLQNVTMGGLARIATRINQLRAQQPNSLLMNIGDTYHGGVEAMFTIGNAIIAPVDALGIDIGVPGNWDFAFSPQVTTDRYNPSLSAPIPNPVGTVLGPNFPNLAGNVTVDRLRGGSQPLLPATAMFNVAGVQVGFIGITSDIVPQMSPLLALRMNFLTARADYLALINDNAQQLRNAGAQIVVVMSELGIHKDLDLANDITPGAVDAVFSAHTHEATFTMLTSNSGTVVVEAGNDTYLGYMDFEIANGAVINKNWMLEAIDDSIAQDPTVLSLVNAARADFLGAGINIALPSGFAGFMLTESIDTIVGTTQIPLRRRQALENTFNNSMTDVMRQFANTDLAMVPGFRFDSIVTAQGAIEDNMVVNGDITLEDLYRFYPVPFYISAGQVSGQVLTDTIEQNLNAVFSTTAFEQWGGWFNGYSGLDLVVDLAAPSGMRIQSMSLSANGMAINPTDMLSIAGCTRPVDQESATTLCSYPGFVNVAPLTNPATGESMTPVDMIRYGLDNGTFNTTIRNNIVDQNSTLMWPNDNVYQPLTGVQ